MRVGRFILYEPFARGGGGTSLHLACMTGEGGLKFIIAIKQLSRASMSREGEGALALAELLDEARIAARVHHVNVVDVLELCVSDEGVFLAMEYVHGATLAELVAAARERGASIPIELACTLVGDVLLGLHAAHVTVADSGERAGIVHRDVAPENILVSADGIAKIGDFGIAKSRGRFQTTSVGQVKGRLAYVAPERLLEEEVTPLCDVYSAGVVLFELLTGCSPFGDDRDDRDERIGKVLAGIAEPPSRLAPVPEPLAEIVRRATALRPQERFPDALAFAAALEEAAERWPPRRVGAWVEELAAEPMAARMRRIEELLDEEPTALRQVERALQSPAVEDTPARARPPRVAIGLALAGAIGAAALGAAALRDPPQPPLSQAATAEALVPEPPDLPDPEPAAPSSSSPASAPPPAFPKSTRAAQPDRSPCVPPYRIDEHGIRRWKKGCVQ